MKQKVLTDVELRARWQQNPCTQWHVAHDTILTPAAQDFLREQGVRLIRDSGTMTVAPIPIGENRYENALTGEHLSHKGEAMTHLRSNLLVPKTHPRIAFRGKLDTLMAQLIGVQLVAAELGKEQLAEELETLLRHLRQILAAEVKEEPLAPALLLGMDSAEIRRVSHNVKECIGIDHPIPSYKMGRMAVALNRLRTQVREAELTAAAAFMNEAGGCQREDILQALNRLSSCVYILFCREVAGRYRRT